MQGEPEQLNDDMVDASHLISYKTVSTAKPLCSVEVKPLDQQRHTLGDYSPDERLKGFSVEFSPDPDPENSVVTQISNTKVGKKYRLHLHVANFGSKAVTAIVHQL